MNLEKAKSILIIGIAGGLARITTNLLSKKYPHLKIIGVDPRKMEIPFKSKKIKFIRMKYTRTNFEALFREDEFDAVLHLGRTSHANANPLGTLAKRLDLNVLGTRRILDLCLQYEVKKVIIMSTFHVYGALSDNPVFIKEEAQLRADFNHPEIRDVVEMDQVATNWMWKNQDILKTVVFRPCNIIGPSINNVIKQYLTSSLSPLPIDYNPIFQFLHEFDMAEILVQSLGSLDTGIYNVAPSDFISLRDAKRRVGTPGIPMSIFLLEQTAKILKKTLLDIPDYLLDYIKFSCLINNNALLKSLPGFKFRFSSKESLDLLRDE